MAVAGRPRSSGLKGDAAAAGGDIQRDGDGDDQVVAEPLALVGGEVVGEGAGDGVGDLEGFAGGFGAVEAALPGVHAGMGTPMRA